MSVRFQMTPQGEVAILPRKDYDELIAKAAEFDEDAGTTRIIERARADIAAGALLLPKHVVDRLADGENAVLVLREWRDVTQTQLAASTSINQQDIADIESGRQEANAVTLATIAHQLDVPLDLFVQD
jgi:DNA-binding XRE family transcriptional regulator